MAMAGAEPKRGKGDGDPGGEPELVMARAEAPSYPPYHPRSPSTISCARIPIKKEMAGMSIPILKKKQVKRNGDPRGQSELVMEMVWGATPTGGWGTGHPEGNLSW